MTGSSSSSVLVVSLLVAFVMASWIGGMAERKGYSKGDWWLFGLMFWPLALVMIWAKKPSPQYFRRCADCGSTDVPFDVPVCKHCGRDERTASVRPTA